MNIGFGLAFIAIAIGMLVFGKPHPGETEARFLKSGVIGPALLLTSLPG